ncbi:hypothetical protein [Allopontixanthobacter sediminis]|uniref:DUF3987 domain-containing protein n=1 Tax=Allopontixanthobacter sediminis TaxID=1689985 RepID=A0A845AXU1_9SPHN|nr:hypothetical protein [Allopontixanthobacter sediminis]MXP43060.1 hypothetical protein [Allopontixanthobacter sediminis]
MNSTTDSPYSAPDSIAQDENAWPEGLLGEIAAYFFNQAPYPNKTIALAGAIGFFSGIVGQKYNTPTGNGLNTYNLVLAHTGRGKEAIADGAGQLLKAIVGAVHAGKPGAPCAVDYQLPGHFASPEGLMKWLANKSSRGFSIQGEFAAKVKAMHSLKAQASQVALLALYLDLFNKSGDGKFLNGMAYSDEAKNTAPVLSPALTIIGESTFDLFDGIDLRAVSNGFLPRFNVFSTEEPRPYLNPNVGAPAPYPLVERLRGIAATCASYSEASPAIRVKMNDEAKARLIECERQATDLVNLGNGNVHAELWNRAYLKAVKLASLVAVGVNENEPVIDLKAANYGIELVAQQTRWTIKKFESGDVGEVAGNESKQRAHILKAVANYFAFEMDWGNPDRILRVNGVIRQSYIQSKLATLPAFKDDRRGATKALKDMLMSMNENGELKAADVGEMSNFLQKKCTARAYYIVEPNILEPYWPESSTFRRLWDFFQTVSH